MALEIGTKVRLTVNDGEEASVWDFLDGKIVTVESLDQEFIFGDLPTGKTFAGLLSDGGDNPADWAVARFEDGPQPPMGDTHWFLALADEGTEWERV